MNEVLVWLTQLGVPQSTMLLLVGGSLCAMWLVKSAQATARDTASQATAAADRLAQQSAAITTRLIDRIVEGDGNGGPSIKRVLEQVDLLREATEADSAILHQAVEQNSKQVRDLAQDLKAHLAAGGAE